jgi:hypothetical protein
VCARWPVCRVNERMGEGSAQTRDEGADGDEKEGGKYRPGRSTFGRGPLRYRQALSMGGGSFSVNRLLGMSEADSSA